MLIFVATTKYIFISKMTWSFTSFSLTLLLVLKIAIIHHYYRVHFLTFSYWINKQLIFNTNDDSEGNFKDIITILVKKVLNCTVILRLAKFPFYEF